MRMRVQHIAFPIVLMLASLGLSSCVYENGSECEPINPSFPMKGSDSYIYLNIRTLAQSRATTGTQEMIERVRFIIIGQDQEGEPIIEYNHLVNFLEESVDEEEGENQVGPVPSFGFFYGYTLKTVPGKKKIYIIANEESVGSLQVNSEVGISSPVEISSFTELLESYKQGEDPGNFEVIMNSLYFTPEYDSMVENNNIYLPYTTVYDIELDESDSKKVDTYLVPVATKFVFNFTNYRNEIIYINGISLAYTHSDNYIMAHVRSTDMNKDFWPLNSEEEVPAQYKDLYWVNWLSLIAEESQNNAGFSQNQDFNAKYGWITDYDMPNDNYNRFVFVAASNPYHVDAAVIDEDDVVKSTGFLSLGPYYVAESKNEQNASEGDMALENGEQGYYLTLNLGAGTEGETAKIPPFVNNIIGNLQSLFRNTSVIINITMRRGEVQIYAEKADWNIKSANGWVVEE